MPAPAVIPAPIAYIKVVAVKKLVVGFWRFVDDLGGVWGISFTSSLDFICSTFRGIKMEGRKLFFISFKMGTGLLGLLRVQVCTVLRPLTLGQSISALK